MFYKVEECHLTSWRSLEDGDTEEGLVVTLRQELLLETLDVTF